MTSTLAAKKSVFAGSRDSIEGVCKGYNHEDPDKRINLKFGVSYRNRAQRTACNFTKKDNQPEPASSLKTSSVEGEDPELARATRRTKLRVIPNCVPAVVESQSLVSSSSDSQSQRSIGFMAAMMRSESGVLRTSRGISKKD